MVSVDAEGQLKKTLFWSESTIAGLVGLVLCVVVAEAVFGRFFPGPNGLGHDYAGGMPAMLAEYYWSLSNGVWAPPWFSPAFCGGIPFFADPGSAYYSLPGLFVRAINLDPLAAAHVTFLLFVGVGFAGAFIFSSNALRASTTAALIGALAFGLNGFYTYRFVVGHLGFHGVMLIPWLALAVTGWSVIASRGWLIEACRAVLGGLIFAYWIHSGAGSVLVPFALGAATLVLVQWARGGAVLPSIVRAVVSSLFGVMISASKLVAAGAYMANFPRSGYLLPGMGSMFESAQLAFLTLFMNLSDIASVAGKDWENLQWALDRHELEYGVTLVPFVLALLGLGAWLTQGKRVSGELSWKSWGSLLLLAALVLMVLAMNTYSPGWNALLKSLPLVGSSSNVVRWFVVLVPLASIGGALALDALSHVGRTRWLLASIAIALMLLQIAMTDRKFYSDQNYDPKPVTTAFNEAKNSPGFMPEVRFIGAYVDEKGNVAMPLNRNDLVSQGVSQLACYIPIFGYRLENFPFKTLRPGPVFQEEGGFLNIKNPSCFVFPEENSCRPGDHFSVSQRDSADKFVKYRAFPFEKSRSQRIADSVTKVSLGLSFLILIFGLMGVLRAVPRKDVLT